MYRDVKTLKAALAICERHAGTFPDGWWALAERLRNAIDELTKREEQKWTRSHP